ncbi:hypothetical protein BDZ89DRAFT_449301 [Hymenopellis radicata]|nr:hypothetical protein BDZ89DRAFT_449301 [Hymenopellis radicata]
MKSLNLKKIQKYAVKNPPVIANAVALPSSPARPPPKTSGTLIEVLFEDDAPIDDSPQDSGAQQSSNANGAALDPENDWEDTVVEGSTKSTFELRRKLYQGVSIKLQPFHDFADYIQEAAFDSQYHEAVTSDCRRCGNAKASYRCQKCRTAPVCGPCLVDSHKHAHFHRIHRWNLQFFEDSSLHILGLVFHLGHDGDKCPCSASIRQLTVIDVNGYHRVNVLFCRCRIRLELAAKHLADDKPGVFHDEAHQLFQSRLWPITLDSPQTAITYEALDNFDIHSNTSKKSAYDYCYALQRLTDAVQPDTVSDCYRAFMRAIRFKRGLEKRRRSGQAQGIDEFITHRRPGSTSIFCPACPDPGWNVSMEEVWEASEADAHKYTKFEQNDGTFNAPRLKKKEDPDDEAVDAGNAYMAQEKEYQAYLDRCEGEEPDPNTCARLRAMKLQSLLKFVNLIVSGIVGTTCSRHVFFEDNSVVDMYGGERFAYATRSLWGALRYQMHQRWIRWAYDIWCQFVKNLKKRLFEDGKFPELDNNEELREKFESLIGRMKGGIPPLHVLGHIWLCRALYGYSHQKNVGKTCPETVETPWAATRICGGSVKHQNHGQRHDSLNTAFDDWNYNKLIKLGYSISKAYVKAKKTYSHLQYAFGMSSSAISEDLRARWEAEYAKPLPEADDDHIIDRFEVNFKGIGANYATVYEGTARTGTRRGCIE